VRPKRASVSQRDCASHYLGSLDTSGDGTLAGSWPLEID
jgi:hypothetical protein